MADTISAIAALLWPLLVFVVLVVFRRPLLQVLGSAEQREWTLEVGGQKLTVKQLSDQQVDMIVDLQKEVAALRETVSRLGADEATSTEEEADADEEEADERSSPAPVSSVLWVDDHPENNAILVGHLQAAGIRVDLAESTREGRRLFDQRRYGAVISDMGRLEDGAEVSDAGLRLLREIRAADRDIPYLVFCSSGAVARHQEAAYAAGATLITSSASALLGALRTE